MLDEERQAIVDGEQLRMLSIAYMIYGGFNVFFAAFGLLYASMGFMFSSIAANVPTQPGQPPFPDGFGAIFVIFGFGIFTAMVIMALLKFLVAFRLRQRRSRGLCFAVAAITCLGIPFGTALGVCTFLVLSRPSVARSFDAPPAPVPA